MVNNIINDFFLKKWIYECNTIWKYGEIHLHEILIWKLHPYLSILKNTLLYIWIYQIFLYEYLILSSDFYHHNLFYI